MPQKPSNKRRQITESWEVSQDKPSPYLPVKFQETNFAPYCSAEEYVARLKEILKQGGPVEGIHRYDELHNMPGHFTDVELKPDGTVWVTFEPEKLGKYWVTLK